jgi:hypothetical protein
LADAITELSTDYNKSRLMGIQGNALFFREYTLEIHHQRLHTIYQKIIDNFHYLN